MCLADKQTSNSLGKDDKPEASAPVAERTPPTLQDRQNESFWQGISYTIAILFNTVMYLSVVCFILYFCMVYYAPSTWVRTLLLLYIPYTLLDKTHITGATRWVSYETIEWVRSLPTFWASTAYFPAMLHKTHDLDPSKQYILSYHPHGVIGMGVNCTLNTNCAGFRELFPGLRRWGVTLREVFYFFLVRDYILLAGFISADRQALEQKLRQGDSIVLITGGAAEALYAQSGRFTLYLKRRQGFLKLALETGAAVVPCLGFGENDCFSTLDVTKHEHASLMNLLLRIRKVLRFSTPLVTWPIPRRNPIHVVVGAPVAFAPGTSVEECHKQYIVAVTKLYNEHKAKYGHKDIPLEII